MSIWTPAEIPWALIAAPLSLSFAILICGA